MFRTIVAASATAVLTLTGAHVAASPSTAQSCLVLKAAVVRVQTALRSEAATIASHNPGSLSSTVASNQAIHDEGVASTAILAGQGC